LLALAGIVVGKQMRGALVPAIPQPLTHLKTYMRITLNVADVSRLDPMLCHQPKLVSDTSIAHWRASWLPRPPSFRFEQRISGQRQTTASASLIGGLRKYF
jgi:hypothetical protein